MTSVVHGDHVGTASTTRRQSRNLDVLAGEQRAGVATLCDMMCGQIESGVRARRRELGA